MWEILRAKKNLKRYWNKKHTTDKRNFKTKPQLSIINYKYTLLKFSAISIELFKRWFAKVCYNRSQCNQQSKNIQVILFITATIKLRTRRESQRFYKRKASAQRNRKRSDPICYILQNIKTNPTEWRSKRCFMFLCSLEKWNRFIM